jgi:preprotein translocase subunit YajC
MNLPLLLAQAAAAPATPAAGPAGVGSTFIVYLIALPAIFYFLVIRPQSRARKEQAALLDSLKTGDDIVTASGILGTVTNVKEKTVLVRIADNVKVEVLKSAVATVVKAETADKAA